jgi:cyclin B
MINFNNYTKPENKEEITNSINDKPTICIEDIYISLKEEEKIIYNSYNLEYMQFQTEVNEQMRGILIDWLAEVNLKFKLREETLFLTVSILDRYLSKNVINRSKLQLVGVASMFIACKFEEIYIPHLKDFVYLTDNAYPYQEILSMEVKILKTLSYDILIPTPLQFFELISKHFNLNIKECYFGRYLLESFLIDYKSVKYSPSLIACTAGYIVMKFFKYKNYQQIYNGMFSPNTVLLKECAKKICFLVDNLGNSNLNSVKKKFSRKEYLQVSTMNFS